MPSPVWILGFVILVVAVVVAGRQFFAEYGRTYGSTAGLALLRSDPDPRVERARRKFLVVTAAAVLLTLWGITEWPRT